MAQAETSVDPSSNPNQSGAPTSNDDPPPASAAHLNSATTPPPAKAAISTANPAPSATAVASTTIIANATLKRPREKDGAEEAVAGTSTDVPAPKRLVKATNDVIYRIVVPSRQIGKVIGRVGHRIQKIREDTKATIKIADAISKNNETI